jgi:cytochrome c55X
MRALHGMLGVVLLAPGIVLAGEPDPSRQRELEHMLIHDCGSCHGMKLTGGLGPALTARTMSERPLEALEQIIARGVPGTPMPPWSRILDPEDIRWLAKRLREGSNRE